MGWIVGKGSHTQLLASHTVSEKWALDLAHCLNQETESSQPVLSLSPCLGTRFPPSDSTWAHCSVEGRVSVARRHTPTFCISDPTGGLWAFLCSTTWGACSPISPFALGEELLPTGEPSTARARSCARTVLPGCQETMCHLSLRRSCLFSATSYHSIGLFPGCHLSAF